MGGAQFLFELVSLLPRGCFERRSLRPGYLPWAGRLLLDSGEGLADGVALEPQVEPDGLVVGELLVEVRQDRPEALGIRRQVVHAFDSMMVGVNRNDSPGRYHLLLAARGRPAQHGWWQDEDVARDKFRRWVGSVGGIPDPRITLTDEETGEHLDVWPDDSPSGVGGQP